MTDKRKLKNKCNFSIVLLFCSATESEYRMMKKAGDCAGLWLKEYLFTKKC
ncbi:MAG: hypothetical protein NWE95_05205 [Candidatus Bathyarchaeota archaeon]|nr:hypothetical protein [Candidatus Bathyarchaeota archaeon]